MYMNHTHKKDKR